MEFQLQIPTKLFACAETPVISDSSLTIIAKVNPDGTFLLYNKVSL